MHIYTHTSITNILHLVIKREKCCKERHDFHLLMSNFIIDLNFAILSEINTCILLQYKSTQ